MSAELETTHISVLLQETIELLALAPGQTVLDGTAGGGGHAEAIAKAISPSGTLIALDVDPYALERAEARLKGTGVKLLTENTNFRETSRALSRLGISHVDRILLDLGFSSDQMDSSGRGFSFKGDEPLFMTLKPNAQTTAMDFVNTESEEEIRRALKEYGEESFARAIAEEIVKTRKNGIISRTGELVDVVMRATPSWYHKKKIHPATKTFQAIRIAVNDELGALESFLSSAPALLSSHGRLAIITFHSLEDRIVKKEFAKWEEEGKVKLINKKVVTPSREEILKNRRSRSAKLRVCEFI